MTLGVQRARQTVGPSPREESRAQGLGTRGSSVAAAVRRADGGRLSEAELYAGLRGVRPVRGVDD
jgi:hypothetical protein